MNDGLGKEAEKKIREWLDRPEEGYCFDRIKDSMTGFYGDANICDFTLYKSPNFYYIESKATWSDRFDFTMLTDYQYKHMLEKSTIEGVTCLVIVLFATYKRAFALDIRDIRDAKENNIKSLNIKKIDKWTVNYKEIKTIQNNRKKLLDYQKEENII